MACPAITQDVELTGEGPAPLNPGMAKKTIALVRVLLGVASGISAAWVLVALFSAVAIPRPAWIVAWVSMAAFNGLAAWEGPDRSRLVLGMLIVSTIVMLGLAFAPLLVG